MENRQTEILSDIKRLVSSIHRQVEELDRKMYELKEIMDPQTDSEPIGLILDSVPRPDDNNMPDGVTEAVSVDEPEPEPIPDTGTSEPMVAEPSGNYGSEIPNEPETESGSVMNRNAEEKDIQEETEEDENAGETAETGDAGRDDDAFRIESAAENKERMAVIDAMSARETWRTDRPGSPVKDIRSAISLNDRVLFINMLFNEDAMSFQECITHLNEISTLDEAVNYVVSVHPEWEMDSEIVYRFMMAVRRKLI